MKKFITALVSFLLAGAMAFGFAACGDGDANNNNNNTENNSSTETDDNKGDDKDDDKDDDNKGDDTQPATSEEVIQAALDSIGAKSYKMTGGTNMMSSILFNGELVTKDTKMGKLSPDKDLTLAELATVFEAMDMPFADGKNNPTDITDKVDGMGDMEVLVDYENGKMLSQTTEAGKTTPSAINYIAIDGNSVKAYIGSDDGYLYEFQCTSAEVAKQAFGLAINTNQLNYGVVTAGMLFKGNASHKMSRDGKLYSLYDLAKEFEKQEDGKTYSADLLTITGDDPESDDYLYSKEHIEFVIENGRLTSAMVKTVQEFDFSAMFATSAFEKETDTLKAEITTTTNLTFGDLGTTAIQKPSKYATDPADKTVYPNYEMSETTYKRTLSNNISLDGTLQINGYSEDYSYDNGGDEFTIKVNEKLKIVTLTVQTIAIDAEYRRSKTLKTGKVWWLDGTTLKTYTATEDNNGISWGTPETENNVTDFTAVVNKLPAEYAIYFAASATENGTPKMYSELFSSFAMTDLFTAVGELYDKEGVQHKVELSFGFYGDYEVDNIGIDDGSKPGFSNGSLLDSEIGFPAVSGDTVTESKWKELMEPWKTPFYNVTAESLDGEIKKVAANADNSQITTYLSRGGEIVYTETNKDGDDYTTTTYSYYSYESDPQWQVSTEYYTYIDYIISDFSWLFAQDKETNTTAYDSYSKVTYNPMLQMYVYEANEQYTYYISFGTDSILFFKQNDDYVNGFKLYDKGETTVEIPEEAKNAAAQSGSD